MAKTEVLDELWGVTNDDGENFLDQDGNYFGVRLWLEGHDFYSSKEEAEKIKKKHAKHYDNLKVVKLTFNLKITSR